MHRIKIVLAAAVVVGGAVAPAIAHYQAGSCIDAAPVVVGTDDTQIAYVLDGNGGVWVFAEGNSHKGLQAGGEHPVLGPEDEFSCYNHPCTGNFVDPGGTRACPSGQTRLAPDILVL